MTYAEEGLALAQGLDDPFVLGRAHWVYGLVCAVSGDTTGAATAYAAALPLLRTANVPFWVALALAELGDALHRAGDVASAVPLLDEALQITRSFGSPFGTVAGLGAVEAARETSGAGRIGDAWHAERIVATARTSLPEPVFVTAWQEGRTLRLAEAVADANTIASSIDVPGPESLLRTLHRDGE
jgi:hypothetical protein